LDWKTPVGSTNSDAPVAIMGYTVAPSPGKGNFCVYEGTDPDNICLTAVPPPP
jgi:hypothetical protein